MRYTPWSLLAVAAVALVPSDARAYIAVSAERLTLPEVVLEFKAVAAVTVDRSDPTRGAVRYRVAEPLAGKWPAEASLKHVLTIDGKPVPDLGTPREGESAVLFWGSFDNRSLVLTERGWYQTRSPGAGDDGWERLTQTRADMARVFTGRPGELIAAIRRLRQAEAVTVAARLKGGAANDVVYVTYDLLDPHRRVPGKVPHADQPTDPKAITPTTAALVKDLSAKTARTRQQAAIALAERGPAAAPVALPALLAVAAKDPELEVRAAALEAIGSIAAGGKPLDAGVTDVLSAAAKDDDRFVAAAAARALGRLGPAARAALPALAKALPDRDADFDFRPLRAAEAARAILLIGPDAPEAAAAVRLLAGDKLLNDDRPDGYGTRVAGARALADAGPAARAALPALVKRLGDKAPDVRAAAAEAVLRADPAGPHAARAVEALAAAASADEPLVRVRAVRAVARVGAPAAAALPAVRARADDPVPAVRRAVAEALGKPLPPERPFAFP